MYYCGIDIAKRSHAITIINEKGEVMVKTITIANDRKGFEELGNILSPYSGEIQIGMEATGHYWLALYDHFSHKDYPIAVINPLQVKAYRKMDIRKRKTDRVDSLAISQYMRFANPSPTSLEMPVLIQLRELSRFRFHLVQQIGDCKRKIICILDRVFPEYETIFSNIFLQTSQRLLKEAVTAEEFADFDLSELEQLLKSASRGRFGKEKADQIHAVASKSVGVSFLSDAIHIEMICLLAQIDLVQEQCKEVEAKLESLMSSISQYITSIPGIGLVTGAMLLGEIGDIHRFDSPEKLVAYAGIDATVFKTGEFTGDEMHMSKRGSHYFRYALWQAAMGAILNNHELKAYYEKKRKEGKPYGVAVGAVCHKLIGRIFIVQKEQRPYINK